MVIGRTRLSQPIHMQSFNVAVECTVTFGREGIAAKLRTKMLRAYGLGKCRCDRSSWSVRQRQYTGLGNAGATEFMVSPTKAVYWLGTSRVHGQSNKGSILAWDQQSSWSVRQRQYTGLGNAARVACTMRCTRYHPLART
jgi:hypothetical protein